MQQKPDCDALVLVDPNQDEEARDEHGNDDRENTDGRRNERKHAVLEPCEDDADARQKKRQDKEPQRDLVDR